MKFLVLVICDENSDTYQFLEETIRETWGSVKSEHWEIYYLYSKPDIQHPYLYGDKFSSLPLPLPLPLRPAVPGLDPDNPPLLSGRVGERAECKYSAGRSRDVSFSVASTTSVSLNTACEVLKGV